ncbi:MAG: hypothetical protein ACLRYM_06040 [Thomasclavelia ramosa]
MINEMELLELYRRKRRKKIIAVIVSGTVTVFLICISGFIYFWKDVYVDYFQPEIKLNKTDYTFSDNSFKIGLSKSGEIKAEDLIKSYNKEYFKMKIGNDRKSKKCLEALKKGTAGLYHIRIIFTSDYYKEEKSVAVNILDDIPPVLELSQESIEVNINDRIDYRSYIVKAEDNSDRLNISDVIYNEINTAVSGIYTLNYAVQDSAGNETSKDIQVTVKQPVGSTEKKQENTESSISSFSAKKESAAKDKFFSGNSIDSYNQALEYAERNSKNGYEVNPTGEGFQVILY